MLPEVTVAGVYVGTPTRLPDGRRSGIIKHAQALPLWLSATGLAGDKVADPRFHGGPEMAVHHYPAEHFARWASAFPDIAKALVPGSIGENISTWGLTEDNIHIGDVFAWGDAEIEVNQARMPCVKIDSRYSVEGLAAAIMEAGLCGWYCRVRKTGMVAVGQPLRHLHRPANSISLAAFWAVQNAHRPTEAELLSVIEAPALAEKWRKKFTQRLNWLRKNT
jgi:MOSC domain-containing protein YiiM